MLHPTLHVLLPRSRSQEKQGQQRQKDEREAAKAPRKRGGQGERDGRGRAHKHTHKTAKEHILENMQLSDRFLLLLYTSIFSTYSNYHTLRMSSCFLLLLYTSIFYTYLNTIQYVYLLFLDVLKSQKILFLKIFLK